MCSMRNSERVNRPEHFARSASQTRRKSEYFASTCTDPCAFSLRAGTARVLFTATYIEGAEQCINSSNSLLLLTGFNSNSVNFDQFRFQFWSILINSDQFQFRFRSILINFNSKSSQIYQPQAQNWNRCTPNHMTPLVMVSDSPILIFVFSDPENHWKWVFRQK